MEKPRKKIEIIYYLIHRMSRNDKRRFKIYNQTYKGGEQDFVKLFDFLNGMETFDIDAIEKFFIKKELKNKNISIAYLLNKLIESIDDGIVHLAYSGHEVLMPHFKAYRTYVKMELMDLAQKELDKIEQLAEQYELYEYMYQIYQMKERMANVLNINTQSREYRRELYLKQIALREKTKIRDDLKYIISLIVNCPRDTQEFKDANEKLLQYNYEKLSVVDKLEYNHARSWYYHRVKNAEQRFKYITKVIEVYHSNPHFIGPFIEDYIATWNNLLLSSTKFKDEAVGRKYYEAYKQLPQKHKKIFATLSDAIMAFYEMIGHLHEVTFSIKYENYTAIQKIGKNALKTFEKFPTSTSRVNVVASLCARISYGFILIADIEQAYFWLDKLSKTQHVSETILSSEVDTLRLLLYYEQAEFSLLKSEIRSFKRKWKKNPPELKSAKFMLELLHNASSKRNSNKTGEFWASAHQQILEIEAAKRTILKYSKWIAQKIR